MKHSIRLLTILVLLLVALSAQRLQAQCSGSGTLLYPQPTPFPVFELLSPNPDTLIMLGGTTTNAMVSSTTNGGTTWQTVSLPFSGPLLAGVAWPGGKVVACGTNGYVVSSTNYGLSWEQPQQISFVNLNSMAATDSIVYVCGELGMVFKSTNYGQSFANTSPGTTNHLYGITTHPNGTVLAVGEAGITAKSTNQGQTWQTDVFAAFVNLRAIKFKNPDTAYIVGDKRFIGLTADTGNTYQVLRVDTNLNHGFDLAFANNQNYLVGAGGLVYPFNGTNGNGTHAIKNQAANADFNATVIFNGHLHVAGANGHLYALNPTDSLLSRQTDSASGSIGIVHAFSPDSIWATQPDKLIATTNGGATWTETNNWPANNYTMAHQHGNTLLLAAPNGATAYTTNRGTTWVHHQPNNTYNLKNLTYLPAQGWLFTDQTALYLSTDTGRTLTALPLTPAKTLNMAHFASANVGYAVADSGYIYKTTNGGNNWQRIVLNDSIMHDSNTAWKAVYFVNEQDGFVAGDRFAGHSIIKTTDGGQSWTDQTVNFLPAIYGIKFFDDLNGYLYGLAGFVAYTTNGGDTWEATPAITNNQLTDVAFAGNTQLILADSKGRLFTTPRCDNLLATDAQPVPTIAQPKPLTIYPNPANQLVNVKIPETIKSTATITITNLTGKIVMQHNILPNQQPFTLQTQQLNTGYYLVTLQTNKQSYQGRFLIIK